MSDTSAGVRGGAAGSPNVDAVYRRLDELASPADAGLARSFAEVFLAKAPPDFLHERSTDALAHLVLGTVRFLLRSHADRVDVQVFNPTVEEEGWSAPVTVVRTNMPDRPFIVDTIREYLHAQDLAIEYLIYPAPHVARAEDGGVRGVRPADPGEPKESLVYCEVVQVGDPAELERIDRELSKRLQDVLRATDDFAAMQEAVNRVVGELGAPARALSDRRSELTEIQSFLRWLKDGAFVFLGYRAYNLVESKGRVEIVVEPGSGLGIMRNEAASSYADGVALQSLDPGLRALIEEGPTLIISKSNSEAPIHRRARMDYVGVKKLDAEGRVIGVHRLFGLFTSRTYAEDAAKIPILRDKLHRLLEASGVGADSHDYKEIHTIFNSMPKEELFLASAEQIEADIKTVLTSYHTDTVRVTMREDVLHRGVSVMVIIPNERYSTEMKGQIEQLLRDVFRGELLNFHLALGVGDQARLHFYLGAEPERLQTMTAAELERQVGELTRSWIDRVREGIERVRPPDEARRLARRYGSAFTQEYRAGTSSAVAVQDILELEAMQAESRPVSVSFSNQADTSWVPGDDKVTELKLYQMGGPLVLSEFMPILENAGLRVIAVNPFEVKGGGVPKAIVYTFAVQDKAGKQVDESRAPAIGQTILAVRAGDVSNDIGNGLVLATGLHWREVDVLRAYSAYAFQLGAVTARFALPNALLKHPHVAKMLFDLFEVKFDPDRAGDLEQRREAARDVKTAIVGALQAVTLLAEDRAFRRMLTLVEATVRTNYYRNGGRAPTRRSGGVPYTSLKFACDAFSSVAKSRLMFEVWVRSSRMEGVHLRGAKVARGGIRWSDRMDDFRTEILGLVNTQVVKNAVIVPSGSKGGFVLLRAPADPEKFAEEGKEQYRTLMRGLLDLTDNIDVVSGDVVSPERVIAFDEHDPYLVVAADKGTARFSDIANGIAAEYGFWLGDAFASGGSQGYDHKAVGITAMGAWECVKRHFREQGKDIQAEPFTVVGIGDMSGDVFGNGMLLSRQTKLVAAFDHRHVLLDPDPDPERSFKERERMFKLPRSSWADYDPKLLSRGGMIVPRGAKEVTLGPEALRVLGLPADTPSMDGEALIRAVLKAPVELLWNGGIGTYVKATDETNSDAGDPPNDAVRVGSHELRAQVVGEGGNLGFTQRARIEYALGGGRIDTDALDNSAGVDLSDHEVNLKILLNPAVRAQRMTEQRRNELLKELTQEVAQLVLQDNRSQSLAVSLDELRVADSSDEFRDLIIGLEKSGLLDRMAEHLPTFEGLTERQGGGSTFVRPELCVLLAYAKLWLKAQVLASELPGEPMLDGYLAGYFPPEAVAEAGEERLHGHRLRREIITSQVTNDLVDLMGSAFAMRVARGSGRPAAEVVRAWTIAAHLADHRGLTRRMAAQKDVPAAVHYRWELMLARMLERATRWVLSNVPLEIPSAQFIDEHLKGVAALRGRFGEIVAGGDRKIYEARLAEVREAGGDARLAEDLATLRFLDQFLEILRVAKETDADPIEVARAFYRVSDVLSVQWIRNAIFEAAEDDRWEQRAALALSDDLSRAHHKLVAQVMRTRSSDPDVDRAAERLITSRQRDVARFQSLLQEIQGEEVMTLSGLSVAVREIARLSENGGAA